MGSRAAQISMQAQCLASGPACFSYRRFRKLLQPDGTDGRGGVRKEGAAKGRWNENRAPKGALSMAQLS